MNPLLCIDFYKSGHIRQMPQGTEYVYENFTARSSRLASKISGIFEDKVVNFGIQGFVKEVLIESFNKNFFQVPKQDILDEYQWHMDQGLGPGVDIAHIAALHDLGYLPIRLKALPEGALVDIKVPLFTTINTHPNFGWLPGYLEDLFSAENWKPITSATTAWQYRKLLEIYAEKTGANKDFILWQGHDFSLRGMSGVADAANSGQGHLLSFLGTDTIPAIMKLKKNYRGAETYIGGSVPATEHSVTCLNGEDNEVDFFRRLITETYPTGVVSIVSDTWDYWNTITNTTQILKEDILNRQPNALGLAKVVFRPDSGDPADIVCGTAVECFENLDIAKSDINAQHWMCAEDACGDGCYGLDEYSSVVKVGDLYYKLITKFEYNRHDKRYYYVDNYERDSGATKAEEVEATPQMKGSIECLYDIFGGTVNEKGYKELNPRVGLIYGDSITLDRAKDILERLEAKGFASSNIVFGIGSYTYQYQTRDSYGFACKATWGMVDGVARDIFKDPKTGDGVKKSAKGLLRVEKEGNDYVLYDQQTPEQEQQGELKTIFEDGQLLVETSLMEIRKRLHG